VTRRLLDILLSSLALVIAAPVIIISAFIVWADDRRSPFFFAERIGKNGKPFRMIKLRSMVVGADKTGIDSTSKHDTRLTRVGPTIRKFKLDELPQLLNVLGGSMSMVGPRPNVRREVALYTEVERGLLEVRPGITDFASIVFSDLSDILAPYEDPDIAYNQLVRPGKNRLGLFYVANRSIGVDLRIIFLTAKAVLSRRKALQGVQMLLARMGAPNDLVELAGRQTPLVAAPPPGSDSIVTSRCA
jgi:lipopolysaccharide/colanic/teichoic acid biosynthesis glycosyltransferase